MSFQDIADEGHYTSGAGWDNTYSESILEESDTYDERTFLDNVMERIDLDEEQYGFDNGRQLELRASNVLDGYDLTFPTDSTLVSTAPNPFPNQNLQYSDIGYQEGPVGYHHEYEQRNLNTNVAGNAYATGIDSTETDLPTQNHTRHRVGAQHHEPQGRTPSAAQTILLAFFATDRYPTTIDKESLAQVTRLTVSQVSTWFNNARHRRVVPSASSLSTFPAQDLPDFEHYQGDQQHAQHSGRSGSSFTPINTDASSIATYQPGPQRSVGEHGRQSPSLEAYQNTPPRDDAPPVTVWWEEEQDPDAKASEGYLMLKRFREKGRKNRNPINVYVVTSRSAHHRT
ncbi:MAG: hypothetical protein LQ347_003629 [Umbilicaria vellea]|nr:MAG: hypothetical protein LQ347_003629 [Umbilicaria vellea]